MSSNSLKFQCDLDDHEHGPNCGHKAIKVGIHNCFDFSRPMSLFLFFFSFPSYPFFCSFFFCLPSPHSPICPLPLYSHQHGNHYGFLHDGHLHCRIKRTTPSGGLSVEEHFFDYDEDKPLRPISPHSRSEQKQRSSIDETESLLCDHTHDTSCGHERIRHGNHFDYLVGNKLHHVADGECSIHGEVEMLDDWDSFDPVLFG